MAKSGNLGTANVELRADPTQFAQDLRAAENAVTGFVQRAAGAVRGATGAVFGAAAGRGYGMGAGGSGRGGGNSPWMAYSDAPMPGAGGGEGGGGIFDGVFAVTRGVARFAAAGAAIYYGAQAIGAAARRMYRGTGARAAGFAADEFSNPDAAARLTYYEGLQQDAQSRQEKLLYDSQSTPYSDGFGVQGFLADEAGAEAAAYRKRAAAARAQIRVQARTAEANRLAAEVIGLGSTDLTSAGNVAFQSSFINVAGETIRMRLADEQAAISRQSLANLEDIGRTTRAQSFGG